MIEKRSGTPNIARAVRKTMVNLAVRKWFARVPSQVIGLDRWV
jgi:hypothetical protein